MTDYARFGELPHKRHTQFPKPTGLFTMKR